MISKRRRSLSAITTTDTAPKIDLLSTLLNFGTSTISTLITGLQAQAQAQDTAKATALSNETALRLQELKNQGLTDAEDNKRAEAELAQATLIKNIVSLGLVVIVLGGGGFLIYKLIKKGK